MNNEAFFSHEELEAILQGDDVKLICEILVDCALNDSDYLWVQGQCLQLSRHNEPCVRSLAATCIGHLARIHKDIFDVSAVLPTLNELLNDPEVVGSAEDALDDIEIFCKKSR